MFEPELSQRGRRSLWLSCPACVLPGGDVFGSDSRPSGFRTSNLTAPRGHRPFRNARRNFSNCWVPQIDVGSQQLSLLRGRCGFLVHFGFCSLIGAIKFFGKSGSLCAAATNVSSGATSSSSAVSRNLCPNCLARLDASPCVIVSNKWKSPSLRNGPGFGHSFFLSACCHGE